MIAMSQAPVMPISPMFNHASGSPTAGPGALFANATPIRKRRAASPPPPFPAATLHHTADPSKHSLETSPTPAKKRRPNLAHGFSSLSLAARPQDVAEAGPSVLPTYAESQHADHMRRRVDDDDNDEDDLFAGNREVRIEEFDPAASTSSTLRTFRRRAVRGDQHSSGSSPLDSDNEFDDLHTYPESRQRRRTQQADEVEHPLEDFSQDSATGNADLRDWQDIGVEDITPPIIGVKRRSSSRSEGHPGAGKRRREDMDIDEEMGEFVEEIPRDAESSRGRTRTRWHEPEKDRIIYTSLGSTSSRSRSRSPSSSPPPPTHLTQPGVNGFTISPSMLTRLLAAQRSEDNSIPLPFTIPPSPPAPTPEMGLVLYRPLGIPPGTSRNSTAFPRDVHGIVKEWQGSLLSDGEGRNARFEMLDEDEDLPLPLAAEAISGDNAPGELEAAMDIDM